MLLCHTLIVREAVVFFFFFLMELGYEFWLAVNLYFATRFFRPIAIVYGYLFFLFFYFFIAIAVFFFCFYLRCSILYSKQIALVSYGKILEKSFSNFKCHSISLLLHQSICCCNFHYVIDWLHNIYLCTLSEKSINHRSSIKCNLC